MRKPSAALLAAATIFATPALAGTDWNKECVSYGLTPGTADFKDCVASMTDADKATNGALMQNSNAPNPSAARVRAEIQADMDNQQAQMAPAANAETPSSANCVTTIHGTNRSTVCGQPPQQRQAATPRQHPQQQWPQPPQHATQQGSVSLVGTWSTGAPPNGFAFAFNPDGTYVNVANVNGLSQRLWGHYRATPVSPTSVRLDFKVLGWAPRAMCAQVIGGARACRPYAPIYSASATLNFTSPSSFKAGGSQFRRDPSPYLLQMQVPDVLERQVAGMGGIRQPVMPALHPYRTPGGPGSVSAMRNDDEHQQPNRICSVNNGSVYTDQNGVQHCTN